MTLSLPQQLTMVLALGAVAMFSYYYFDRPLMVATSQLSRNIIEISGYVTLLGTPIAWNVAAALAVPGGAWLRLRTDHHDLGTTVMVIALGVLVTWGVVSLCKFGLGRYRPMMFLEEGLYGFKYWSLGYNYNSFPSSHAAVMMALAVGLGLVYRPVLAFAAIVALVIAATRLTLNLHYLSDVLAGIAIGLAVPLLLRHIAHHFALL